MKLSYFGRFLVTTEDDPNKIKVPATVIEMRKSLKDKQFILIDNFIEWALIEHKVCQLVKVLKDRFDKVSLITRINSCLHIGLGDPKNL
jgi:hypothetical protein